MTTLNYVGLLMIIIPMAVAAVILLGYFVHILITEAFDESALTGYAIVGVTSYIIAAVLFMGVG